jgi:SAM-dependent methyltransferase
VAPAAGKRVSARPPDERLSAVAGSGVGAGAPTCLACHGALSRDPVLVARDRMHGIPGSWAIHGCADCASGTTLPLAAEGELGAFYPPGYAPFDLPRGVIARLMHHMQRARNRRFPLAELGADRERGRLLDVGCGRGDLAASWIEAGWSVLGIEPSTDAARVARARGAEVREGTLSSVSLEPESLDAAVFRHSLEHVVDPQQDLRRVLAALRPGGRLAVIVPNWGSWQRRAFGEYWFPLELPRHRTHFTADGLRAALAGAGFERIDIRPATPYITTTWSLQFQLFGRLLTEKGAARRAGYAACAPISAVSRVLDAARGGGDFLHAAARRPA